MFRFLHTADWQMGMMSPGLGEAAAERVRAARVEALAGLLDLARRREVDAILVAGDQFEHNQVSPALVEQVVGLLNDRTRIPLYLIPGNHDPIQHDSVYRRPVWDQLRGHIHVLTDRQPVTLTEGVTLFPCPLRHKFGHHDPTAWIPPRESGDRGLRIGLAHGTMPLRDSVRGDDDPIPIDAPRRAGLDYLALGHVHATIVDVERRAGYCGAHETTRFGEGESGNAVVVGLAPGAPPEAEVVRTGLLWWRDRVIDLDRQPLAEAARELREDEDAARTLLRVRLQGRARPDHHSQMASLVLPMLQQRFLYHRIDDSELRPASFDETFCDLLAGAPHLQQAAQRLRTLVDGGESTAGHVGADDPAQSALDAEALAARAEASTTARRALEILQEVVWGARQGDTVSRRQ